MNTIANFDELFNAATEQSTVKAVSTTYERWDWDKEALLVGYFVGLKEITPKDGSEAFTVMKFVTLDDRCVEVSGSRSLLKSLSEDDELGYRIYRIEFKGMVKMSKGQMRAFNVKYAKAITPIEAYLYA